jgi:AP-4 complex subunit mu-1
LIYELIDEIIDFGFIQFTDTQRLKNLVNTEAEKLYSGTFDYLSQRIGFDKLKLVDSVSEKDSERSIKKPTNDIFIEINEKISACFNSQGFAIHIKVNGLVLVKNYIIKRINCKIAFNDKFQVQNDSLMSTNAQGNAALSNNYGQSPLPGQNQVRVTQIQETVDYDILHSQRVLNFVPPLGQCIAMQYELPGQFNMLPVKLYP